jgi:SSS family solute:Na+ symporter
MMPDLPFMDRMSIVFLLCVLVMALFALVPSTPDEGEPVTLRAGLFRTDKIFKIASAVVILLLAAIYIMWW